MHFYELLHFYEKSTLKTDMKCYYYSYKSVKAFHCLENKVEFNKVLDESSST